jgi:NAD(P)-dependent dehydrogenase (short-subunit alcohol dehydrogenase family)
VNDLGGSMAGDGTDAGPAQEVVDEIVATGGTAVADTSDIATEAGGAAVVGRAVAAFGRIDALVANAGIMRWARFPDVEPADLDAHVTVHVGGSFHTTRAAWPHFAEQGFGRIVLTTSTGLLGLPGNTSYAIAKGGVIGLMRSLALAGAKRGIRANCIAPAASTRMAGDGGPDMPPELVAPMAAFLAHEDCPVSGEIYTAGAGRFARLFIGSTPGWLAGDEAPTLEDVAAHWAAINDETGYDVPADLMGWSAAFLAHLPPQQ